MGFITVQVVSKSFSNSYIQHQYIRWYRYANYNGEKNSVGKKKIKKCLLIGHYNGGDPVGLYCLRHPRATYLETTVRTV